MEGTSPCWLSKPRGLHIAPRDARVAAITAAACTCEGDVSAIFHDE